MLLPGRAPGGLIGAALIGVANAFIGRLSAHCRDRPKEKHFFDSYTWSTLIGGSLALLVGHRILFGDSRD
ncbi:transglycosylase [Streptomyces colonosanans]|uniref:Transglycosylase n=1 Tax=Streptomyces colonosanans TaxID=1428652 RepID=A0A1S2PIF0_9ACTN|nr:transglycosylase [Streptomyces colonosanans]OIJ93316.1 transglycosylase [Streptomyces colonosanans]